MTPFYLSGTDLLRYLRLNRVFVWQVFDLGAKLDFERTR